MDSKRWEALKTKDREIVYEADPRKNGKAMKYPLKPSPIHLSKHDASKRGHKHNAMKLPSRLGGTRMTQHERVVTMRMARDPKYQPL